MQQKISFSKTSFEQRAVLKDHTNFVIATCYIPPSDQFPDGLIVTGGNDKTICVYSAKQGTYLFTLEGHELTGKDTVFFKIMSILIELFFFI
jgi:WD40 repeat protein